MNYRMNTDKITAIHQECNTKTTSGLVMVMVSCKKNEVAWEVPVWQMKSRHIYVHNYI